MHGVSKPILSYDTIPEPYILEAGSRIMSLQDPDKKMSKSDNNLNNIISLLDSPDVVINKINRSVTDSGNEIKYNLEKMGLSNLISIYSSITEEKISVIEEKYKGKMYSDFKNDLGQIIVEFLKPIQYNYSKIINDKEYLHTILDEGKNKASYKARKTLSKVYRKVGFIKSK